MQVGGGQAILAQEPEGEQWELPYEP